MTHPSTSDLVDVILDHVGRRAPACGGTTVVAIDGRSGAGKSTLATDLARRWEATLVRFDDLYAGWHGLGELPPRVARELLAPLALGQPGATARWSWVRDRPTTALSVPPTPRLVLDGVGSGAAPIRPYLSLLVWVEAPEALRRERALARDGDTYRPWWQTWADQEQDLLAREATPAHADLVVHTAA